MQCNPQLPFFVSGPPNCSQFYPCPQNFNQPQLQQFQPLCNSAQYPDVIGEGEVVSVVLADGTVQLYFMPTTNWTNCMRNTNPNQGWNQNAGAWFVRSINNPPCPLYPSQNNPACGARNYNTPALPPCQGFEMKFHNDQCTSTGDIEYFFPRLRTCDVTPRSCAGVQAAIPEKSSCFGMVCDAPCHCKAECSGARKPIFTGHVSYGDTKCDSDMSIEETREKTSCRGSKRRKGQTDYECHCYSSNSSEGKDRKRQKKSKKKPIKSSCSQTSSTENCQSSGRKHKPCENLEKERKAWEKERKKQEQELKKQEREWKKKEKEFVKKVKQLEKKREKREKVKLEKEKKEKKEQGKKSASSQSDDEFDDYGDSCTCSACTSSVCRTMSGLSGRISCSDSFMSLDDSKNSDSQDKMQKQREKEQRKIKKEQEKQLKKEQKQLEKALKEQEKKFRKELHLKKKTKDRKEDKTRKDSKDSIEDDKNDGECSCSAPLPVDDVCCAMSGLSGRISCSDSSMSLDDSKNSDSEDKMQKQREKEQRKIKKEQEKQLKKEQKQLEKALKEQEKKFRKVLHLKKMTKDRKEDKTRKDSKDSIEDGKNDGECSCFAPLPVDNCANFDSPMSFNPNTNSVPLETCCCDTGVKIVDCMEGTKYDVGSLCVCPPTSDKILGTNSQQSNNSCLDLVMKGLGVDLQNCMPPEHKPCSPSREYISCNSNNSISPHFRPV